MKLLLMHVNFKNFIRKFINLKSKVFGCDKTWLYMMCFQT